METKYYSDSNIQELLENVLVFLIKMLLENILVFLSNTITFFFNTCMIKAKH